VTSFGLLGAEGQADETAEYALPDRPAFRAVSREYLDASRNDLIDITTDDPALRSVPVVAAVGAPGLKRELVAAWGGSVYRTVVSSAAWVSPSAMIGEGCILAPLAAVTSRATLGDHVLINIGASISHDAVVGNFVTISPGSRIGGRVRIGDGVFIGIGATVSSDVVIASGTVIGAGAVVVHDIAEPGVYIGVPARRLRVQEDWLRAI
jgi:sugar O-acyltransferase (sialic acid O-acetyltransferase NeuD family)